MTMVYAVEAWILALVGWGWLSIQEMWSWSLLSAHAFYGLIWLSTCNVIASGISPASIGPRSAYFSAVLILFLFCLSATLDTLASPQVFVTAFASPYNETKCSLAKTQQLFFFGDSPLYLVQAGATVGYLVVQLVLAGAAMLDSGEYTLWPGAAWGMGLTVLLCARFISTFDGSAKGLSSQSKYVELFTLPVVEITVLFVGFMYTTSILLGVEGLVYPGLVWRKSVRYVSFGTTILFCIFSFYVLGSKGLLTPSQLLLFGLIVMTAVISLVDAVRADQPPAKEPVSVPVFQPYGPAGYARPSAPYSFPATDKVRSRLVIPSPVEMMVEKNKGV
jgi:hypothetical protein